MPPETLTPAASRRLLARRDAELDAIQDIFRAINVSSDLRAILSIVTQTTTRALKADSCSIYLLDVATQRLMLKATTGLFPEAVDRAYLTMGQGLTGWAAQHRQAVAVTDAWKDERFHMLPDTRERPFKSLMAVPLKTGERMVGSMNVQTLRRRVWTEGDVEFASLIADVVAGVLERAVLQEGTERTIRELSAVSQVSKAVTAPVYLDETLRVVAEMAAKAVNARRCSLLLLDEGERAYVSRAVYDQRADTAREPSWRLGKLPLRSGGGALNAPLLLASAQSELADPHAAWAGAAGLRALLCVPLVVHERCIGLMNVWAGEDGALAPAQVELCTTLANQIALAIENAHLVGNAAIVQEMHHRVKNNLQNIVMLLQIQMGGNQNLSAKEVLQESVNRIMSIAAVHDAMAQGGFRLVDVKDVIERVVHLTHGNMTRPDQRIEIDVRGDAIKLSARAATSLALCVNELVQNALEHAFVGRDTGRVIVTLADRGGRVVVEVRDDGRGGDPLRDGKSPSLGLNIVTTLVSEDLRGTFKFRRGSRGGSVAVIEAPVSFV